MSVIEIEVTSRAPFAGGLPFGAGGAYERIDGILRCAVDPQDPANAGIVDLDKAPRDAEGRVHFSADLCLLQPVDAQRGNRRLLLEVPNRGRKGALNRFNRPTPVGAPALDTGGIEVGDGLLLHQGWTIVWCGWQWDVIRENAPHGLVGFDPPQALDAAGRPIQGQMLLEWQLDAPQADKLLADRVHKPYPAADLDEATATLWTREYPEAPRVEVPRHRWRFARDRAGTPVPDATHVWLEGGFQPGVLYDLRYTTSICPVVGTGLLAIRDSVSFLRYGSADAGNPCAGRIDYTIGTGSSQCGRFLREFLLQGLNLDEAGRPVYDGLLIHVAGARRGEFNHRYAQPSVITIPSLGYLPPFAFEDEGRKTEDEWGRQSGFVLRPSSFVQVGGLLDRQRQRGGVPKIIATNTSAEYWNREASLAHTDPTGQHDLEPPEEVRVYLFAGTKHGPGSLAPEEGVAEVTPFPGSAQRPNVVDFTPLLRAAFFNLERWITTGEAPPPNAFPRLADGTASPPADVLAAHQRIPHAAVPEPQKLYVRRTLDLGPDAGAGVVRLPAVEGEPYPWYVSALDVDGNERAGIRLPDIAVPVATHTGWFPRRPVTGGAGQNVDMIGTTVPFARDAAARRQADDPRPSIAERYRDRDDYAAHARTVAEQLAADGYLLPEDVDPVVRNALARYDAFC